jgi:hypothetical protein
MTLDEITALEYEWLGKMPDRGFFEQRDARFQMTGVYDAWRRIFREYVGLARTGDKEALKRAAFLYWYSLSEPKELNGIPALDKELVREVLGLVDSMLQSSECDAELKWMLPYYYAVADFYLTGFGPGQSENFLRASQENKDLWMTACLAPRLRSAARWASIGRAFKRTRPNGDLRDHHALHRVGIPKRMGGHWRNVFWISSKMNKGSSATCHSGQPLF